tara:strand:+ start:303 stop:596 length:294 start_codon:yes stop_codon:yes gene_type:complete
METVNWSKKPYEEYRQSKKDEKPITNIQNEIIHNVIYRGEQINKKKILEDSIENSNKIKELNNRIFIRQVYINPFLNQEYDKVLENQDKYLIPKNSN